LPFYSLILSLFTVEVNTLIIIPYLAVLCIPLVPIKGKNPRITYADLYQVILYHIEFSLVGVTISVCLSLSVIFELEILLSSECDTIKLFNIKT
jgi:hypothetical protein